MWVQHENTRESRKQEIKMTVLVVQYPTGTPEMYEGTFEEMYEKFNEYKGYAEVVKDYVFQESDENVLAACWIDDTLMTILDNE
jgi:hypothetical protein